MLKGAALGKLRTAVAEVLQPSGRRKNIWFFELEQVTT